MLYREVGQYKTSYAADMAVFPILQDRVGLGIILLAAFVIIPLTGNEFLLNAVMIPFLIFSLMPKNTTRRAICRRPRRSAGRYLTAIRKTPAPSISLESCAG